MPNLAQEELAHWRSVWARHRERIQGRPLRFAVFLGINVLATYVPSFVFLALAPVTPPAPITWEICALAPIILPFELMGSLLRGDAVEIVVILTAFLAGLVCLTSSTFVSRRGALVPLILFIYSVAQGLAVFMTAI